MQKISNCGYQYQDDVLDVRGLQVSICWSVFSGRFASNIHQSKRGVHSVHLTTLSHVILQVLRRESFELKDHRWKISWQTANTTFVSFHYKKRRNFTLIVVVIPKLETSVSGDTRNSVTRSVLPAHAISQVPDFNFNNDSFFSRNDIQHQTFSEFEAQQRLFVLLGKWTEWPLKSLKRLKHFPDLGSETVHRT